MLAHLQNISGHILKADHKYVSGFPVHCQWNSWSTWSHCSRSCGGGKRYKMRTQAKKAKHGGNPCIGGPTHAEQCGSGCCPGNYYKDAWQFSRV